ncbi:hypothetical protein KY284_020263 [Solanum tuberosum]|nr:hypothetical protein KY284_020263 [Solanum tuberosum]
MSMKMSLKMGLKPSLKNSLKMTHHDPKFVAPREVYLPQGKKSKRLKQSEKNESISNTKEKGFESKQSSKSIEESGC